MTNHRVQDYRLLAIAVTALVFFLHLGIAPLIGLGVDEAHYALYALHPALSYFDHPPMVGWLQMLVAPLEYNEFSLRLIPAILLALCSWQLFRLTLKIYPDGCARQGLVAVLLINSAPIIQLLGWGMVPDLPLILLSLLIVEQVHRISSRKHWKDWLILGILLGLAGLCKYTAALLLPGLLVILFRYHSWGWLCYWQVWLASVLALLIISPVLIWNAHHDWASFYYQLGHAKGDDWQWRSLISMQLFQMLCYTILVYVAGILATIFAFTRRERGDWLVISFSLPYLLVINWSSGHGEVLPNWPALGWVLLLPLIANWLCLFWHRLWVKVLVWSSSLIAVPLVLFMMMILALKPMGLFPFMQPLVKDLIGWEDATRYARNFHKSLPAGSVLLVDNWSKASRLAWYAQPVPVQVLDDKITQYDFWFGRPDPVVQGILLRDHETTDPELEFHTQGMRCQLLDQSLSEIDGVIINHFQYYLCQSAHY